MKVFFIGERRYQENQVNNKKIIDILEKSGVNVDNSLMKFTHEEDNANFENAYQRNLKSIKACDFIVAEITTSSSGIGFLLATALNQKKPVIALYNSQSKIKPSITLEGASGKFFLYNKYSPDNLEQKLISSVEKVKQSLDTKFILIISPEIDRYLEATSTTKRMHKAQIVRNAVEDMMAKDKEWKKVQDKI